MLAIRPIKYLFSYTAIIVAFISFTNTGILAYATVLYAYALIPLIELFLKPNNKNLTNKFNQTSIVMSLPPLILSALSILLIGLLLPEMKSVTCASETGLLN